MPKFSAAFFFVSALCILTACETVRTAPQRGGDDIQTKSVLPVPGSRTGDGAVLLVAEIQGDDVDAEMTCRWRMINQDSGKSFFLTVKAGEPKVFGPIDPGTYKTGRFGCGVSRIFEIDNVFKDGFRVEAGRASYLGKIHFKFKGAELDVVRKGSRSESSQAMAAAIEMTPANKMEIISGFTGELINRAKNAQSTARDSFDVYAKGVENPQATLAPLITTLKVCAKEPSDADQNGHLEYIAIYKSGRFSEMKSRDAQGLSDRLRSCVERGMMAFHPDAKADIELRVRY